MSPDSPTTQIHFGELHRGHVIVLPKPDRHGPTWTVVDRLPSIGDFEFIAYITADKWEGIHGEPPSCPVVVTTDSHLRRVVAA